jgi:glyoxylase-like metal-dependent hydrolase (beta-lactamase superfamily II)
LRVFAVPGHTQRSAAYPVDDVLFMGDAADTKSDDTVIGSPWVFSDSQPQDRASLVALDERLTRENVPVKVIAFAHSGRLANGRAPLDAYAASRSKPAPSDVSGRRDRPRRRGRGTQNPRNMTARKGIVAQRAAFFRVGVFVKRATLHPTASNGSGSGTGSGTCFVA